jgi:hypothetical protein
MAGHHHPAGPGTAFKTGCDQRVACWPRRSARDRQRRTCHEGRPFGAEASNEAIPFAPAHFSRGGGHPRRAGQWWGGRRNHPQRRDRRDPRLQLAGCHLDNSSYADRSDVRLGNGPGHPFNVFDLNTGVGANILQLNLQDVVVSFGRVTVTMLCGTYSGVAFDGALTAVKVGALH